MNIMVRVLHRYTWLYNQIGDEQICLDNPNSADENLALTKQGFIKRTWHRHQVGLSVTD